MYIIPKRIDPYKTVRVQYMLGFMLHLHSGISSTLEHSEEVEAENMFLYLAISSMDVDYTVHKRAWELSKRPLKAVVM